MQNQKLDDTGRDQSIEVIVNDTHYLISQLSDTEDIERAKQALHKNVKMLHEVIKLTMQLYKAADAAMEEARKIAHIAIDESVKEVNKLQEQLQQ